MIESKFIRKKGAKAPIIPFKNKNNNSGHILHLPPPLFLPLSLTSVRPLQA
jgi:hypothetical protein